MTRGAGTTRVHLVRTGAANLASVEAALRRVGAEPILTESPEDVRGAERLVLPGVGAFGAAMERLTALGLVEPLRERALAGHATLAVCLGMQVLMESSEESPGVAGLGVARLGVAGGGVTRIDGGVRVPHFGWNAVRANGPGSPIGDGLAYFANSFRIAGVPEGWSGAWTEYGRPFVAMMWRGRVLACQFHPELSGAWGAALLAAWLRPGSTGKNGASEGALVAPGVRRRVIPCLDVRDGRVVKGVRFQNLRDAGDPAQLAAAYEAQGADELTLLDVSATPDGRATASETVRRVREVLSIPLTVGGGVRSIDDAQRLLEAGADKVGVNSAAVRDPALLTRLAERFGRQCVVLALDAARREGGGWEVVVESGRRRTGLDAVAWAAEAERRGAGEILLTSWDRDGTRSGYDLELLRAVSGAVGVPVIASGGAAGPEHLIDALHAGADAVLAASIFHDGERTVADVKKAMAGAGIAVRVV